ncbi:hypothetical protein Tco_0765173 [Tanacetum coccineum]
MKTNRHLALYLLYRYSKSDYVSDGKASCNTADMVDGALFLTPHKTDQLLTSRLPVSVIKPIGSPLSIWLKTLQGPYIKDTHHWSNGVRLLLVYTSDIKSVTGSTTIVGTGHLARNSGTWSNSHKLSLNSALRVSNKLCTLWCIPKRLADAYCPKIDIGAGLTRTISFTLTAAWLPKRLAGREKLVVTRLDLFSSNFFTPAKLYASVSALRRWSESTKCSASHSSKSRRILLVTRRKADLTPCQYTLTELSILVCLYIQPLPPCQNHAPPIERCLYPTAPDAPPRAGLTFSAQSSLERTSCKTPMRAVSCVEILANEGGNNEGALHEGLESQSKRERQVWRMEEKDGGCRSVPGQMQWRAAYGTIRYTMELNWLHSRHGGYVDRCMESSQCLEELNDGELEEERWAWSLRGALLYIYLSWLGRRSRAPECVRWAQSRHPSYNGLVFYYLYGVWLYNLMLADPSSREGSSGCALCTSSGEPKTRVMSQPWIQIRDTSELSGAMRLLSIRIVTSDSYSSISPLAYLFTIPLLFLSGPPRWGGLFAIGQLGLIAWEMHDRQG